MFFLLLAFVLGCAHPGNSLAPVEIFPPVAAPVQQGGNGAGRTTGGSIGVHSFSYSPGLSAATCSGTTCNGSQGPVSPGSQAVSGTLHFASSHDASGSIGGSTGGGTGLFQVSCDGGSTWVTIVNGAATLPTTGMSITYISPTCTGPSNTSTLQFRAMVAGGGASGYNESFTPSSQVTITW